MRSFRLILLLMLLLGIGIRGETHGPAPDIIPIPRLISNITAYIKAHPDDPDGYYTLGRVHYFAFTAPAPKMEKTGAVGLLVYRDSAKDAQKLPGFFNGWGSFPSGKTSLPQSPGYARSGDEQLNHIRAALINLRQAIMVRDRRQLPIKKDGDLSADIPGLYELCLACALEDGAPFASKVGKVSEPGITSQPESWRARAQMLYLTAYTRAKDEKIFNAHSSIAHEAGESYIRLLRVSKKALTAEDEKEIAGIKAKQKEIEGQPQMVTPIIFRLTASEGLADLLTPNRKVRFDMAGTGRPALCSWVSSDTALLVWDPEHTGKIKSGRQLFGSVTWWLFWNNGYAALRSLDNDGDGVLRGEELAGLALWFDRNGNGVSDAGEVIPLEQSPVAGLRVEATGSEGGSPMNAQGLLLKDGTTLPTWDWVVTLEK